jgi:3-hydroxyisobutyryl-CoA hydrolase
LISNTIAEFDTGLPSSRPTISGSLRQIIDRCFAHDSPLAILKDLEDVVGKTNDENIKTWAQSTIDTIRERSPIGVSVTLREMRLGKSWNIAQAFQNEHAIACEFMRHPDFVNGVTSRLITRSKERPNWKPNTLEDVTKKAVDKFYAECGNEGSALKLMHSGPQASYTEYPHAWLALPTERQIASKFADGKSTEEVVQEFLKETHGKTGVREKVEEFAERK